MALDRRKESTQRMKRAASDSPLCRIDMHDIPGDKVHFFLKIGGGYK